MRGFFINSLEKLINNLVILMLIAILVGTVIAWSTPSFQGGGFLRGLFLLVGGAIYVVVMAGMMSLFLGIYQNKKRTDERLQEKIQ